MRYNFVLIRTQKGGKYARKILNSIKWLNENKYPQHDFITQDMTISQFIENFDDGMFGINRHVFKPENTIIHARCANPRTDWTIMLRELEEEGYKVVNSVDAIELTSDKLACSLHLVEKVAHPLSWEYQRGKSDFYLQSLLSVIDEIYKERFIIAKPLTSLEQGANVRKIELGLTPEELREEFDKVPGKRIVLQEYIPYTALHRVIVIGGKALPYTFVDYANDPRKKGEWKVSCCLNKTTMRLNEITPPRLLQLAEDTQKAVGGSINFIDIFEYPWKDGEDRPRDMSGNFTNAEINTACSLNIHENRAKLAGRKDWNIHSRIAKQLVKELGI